MKKTIIYIVDDNADDRFFLKSTIHSILPDAKVISFVDGMEVLNEFYKISDVTKLFDELPDVVFLDLNLTTLDGKAVLEEMQKHVRLKPIKVIILSGNLPEDKDAYLKAGASGIYLKPEDLEEYKKLVSSILLK